MKIKYFEIKTHRNEPTPQTRGGVQRIDSTFDHDTSANTNALICTKTRRFFLIITLDATLEHGTRAKSVHHFLLKTVEINDI